MLHGHYGGPRRRKWVGIIQIGDARGMGILSGLGGDHQRVVAFDLQPAAVEYRVVAQVGVEANVATGRRVLVAHRSVRGVPHQLVQAGDWDQFIPIHPANTPDTLVTRPADTPAQEEVMLSPVQAGPGVGAPPMGHCHAPSKSSVGMLALVPASYTLSPHSAKTTSMPLVPSVVSLHSVQSVSGP